MGAEMGSWSAGAAAIAGGGEIDWMGAEMGSWSAGAAANITAVGGEKGVEIGDRTVNVANITAGDGEKGSEMILAARGVLDPLPAWLLLLIFAFAAYDRREEDVWEGRGREFDQLKD